MNRLIPLLAVGCAPWVWNGRYIDCDELDSVLVHNYSADLALRVRPYEEAEEEDRCEIQGVGLWNSEIWYDSDTELTMENIKQVDFRVPNGELSLPGFFAVTWGDQVPEWGEMDEVPTLLVQSGGTPEPAQIEIDRVERDPEHFIDTVSLDTVQPGSIILDEDKAEIICNQCELSAGLSHNNVRVTVRDPTGPVRLCVRATESLRLVLAEVDRDLPEGGTPTPIEIEIIERPEGTNDIHIERFWDGGSAPDPLPPLVLTIATLDPSVLLSFPGVNDNAITRLVSDGRCDVGTFE